MSLGQKPTSSLLCSGRPMGPGTLGTVQAPPPRGERPPETTSRCCCCSASSLQGAPDWLVDCLGVQEPRSPPDGDSQASHSDGELGDGPWHPRPVPKCCRAVAEVVLDTELGPERAVTAPARLGKGLWRWRERLWCVSVPVLGLC